MKPVNSILFKAIQEHLDNNYNPSILGDGIDWLKAREEAHLHLDPHFGFEAVENALNFYHSNTLIIK